MAAARAVWWVWLVLSWSTPAAALSVQELSTAARGRVAHLSIRDGKGDEQGSGSGFVISSRGRLVTNFHVIDGADSVVAVFPGEREAKVTGVWAFDKLADIAILQLESGSYAPLTLATDPAREAEEIVVIGSPLGLGSSVSVGVVSAVREKGLLGTRFGERDPELASWGLQFTAAAAPGSSGSPIMRMNGEVVGVLVGHIGALPGVNFGIVVEKVHQLSSAAPKHPLPLTAASGTRTVQTNLLISAAFFGGLTIVWLAALHLHRRIQARRAPRLPQ